MFDVIPDIHGQVHKLTARLVSLGYSDRSGAWRHSDPQRQCVFLGDFIDRGPANGTVIDIVRRMVDAGTALAIMGNHELNAIHFHTRDPESGMPLRLHSQKNTVQHAAFLREFPFGSAVAAEAIAWMRSLPLFVEANGARFVHACWEEAVIEELAAISDRGVLQPEQLIMAGRKGEKLHGLLETTTKGPEAKLPQGYSFCDKGGHVRNKVRLKWWEGSARTWRDVAISVPDPLALPAQKLPDGIVKSVYPSKAPIVFFGHYWLDGATTLQAPNALCLDYSAGKDGPLIAYRMQEVGASIDLANIVTDRA